MSRCWIFCFILYYFRWSFWILFLLRNWLSWAPCVDRNSIPGGWVLKNFSLSSYWKSSPWIWVSYTILAFCGHSLIIPLHFYLLLRFLVLSLFLVLNSFSPCKLAGGVGYFFFLVAKVYSVKPLSSLFFGLARY